MAQTDTPRTDAVIEVLRLELEHCRALTGAVAFARSLERDNARLREALEILEMALKTDGRDKTIEADSVEYHIDGQAMYRAINAVRAALSPAQA